MRERKDKMLKRGDKIAIFSLIAVLFISFSCTTKNIEIKQRKIIGIYNLKGLKKSIQLSESGRFFIFDSTTYGHQKFESNFCKLKSYGQWHFHKKDFIEINTSEDILYPYLNATVTSDSLGNDSLYFYIKTNIPKELERFVTYSLIIDYEGEYDFKKEFSKSFHSNVIALNKPHFGVKLNSLIVSLRYTNPNNMFDNKIGFEFVSTDELKLNKMDDYFVIEIPDLDICYFEYARYKGDYIRILNQHTLLWNNEKYEKTN